MALPNVETLLNAARQEATSRFRDPERQDAFLMRALHPIIVQFALPAYRDQLKALKDVRKELERVIDDIETEDDVHKQAVDDFEVAVEQMQSRKKEVLDAMKRMKTELFTKQTRKGQGERQQHGSERIG